jgi:queuine tRNA-ribosyltransferase
MLDVEVGEIMHPVGGPGEESREIYVGPSKLAARLSAPGSDPLVLLDVGLGAGSNAAAAWRVSESLADGCRPLSIVSFDNTTEPLELALSADHAEAFGLDGPAGDAARTMLDAGVAVSRRTSWRLVRGELPTSFEAEPRATADIVFWDLFSPKSNPRLWSVSTFEALRRLCRPGATLHTYTAATASRAAMLLAGFAVGRGPITGDRETTIAAMAATELEHPLGARWLSRLSRSSAPLPPDASPSALDEIALLPQFCAPLR